MILKKSILVIDDDAGMLRALEKVLSSEGALVTCAQWAGDAIDILLERKKRFHLVISDLRMPVFSGLTSLYAIHQIFPELPVMILTAFGSPEIKAECLRQGAAAFLEKPLNTEQLLAEIQRVLSAHQTGSKPAASDRNVPDRRPQAEDIGGRILTKERNKSES